MLPIYNEERKLNKTKKKVKMKKLKVVLSSLVLGLSSFALFAITPHAFAATKTWTGGGSDTNMNTAGNWTGGAPVAGDDLVFPVDITNRTVVNNYAAATSFNSITFSGTATQNSDYTFSGNSITLVAGITNSMTGSFALTPTIGMPLLLNGTQTFQSSSDAGLNFTGTIGLGTSNLTVDTSTAFFQMTGVISGSGNITKTGSGYLILMGANTNSGAISINTGAIVAENATALGTTAGITSVANGASLLFTQPSGSITYAEPLTLNGTGLSASTGTVEIVTSFNMGGGKQPPYDVTTLSGNITLQSDVKIGVGGANGKLTGAITGANTITLLDGSVGSLEIASSSNGSATANTVLTPAAKETTYSTDQTGVPITVNMNETATVTGIVGDVSVNSNGTLKGTGTVGNVLLLGTIAPGMSPGCLTTGNLSFFAGSTYQAELGGTTACIQYDQLKVTGTVDLGSSDLNVSLYNNFKPTAGQKFTIIDNDGSDAISSTFNGLAQGATITVGSYKFTISYTGGDGNDVVLTALAGTPDTGFALIRNNPVVTMGIMIGAAAGVALVARRSKLVSHRR